MLHVLHGAMLGWFAQGSNLGHAADESVEQSMISYTKHGSLQVAAHMYKQKEGGLGVLFQTSSTHPQKGCLFRPPLVYISLASSPEGTTRLRNQLYQRHSISYLFKGSFCKNTCPTSRCQLGSLLKALPKWLVDMPPKRSKKS